MTDCSSCARSRPARPRVGLFVRSLSIRRSAAATRSRARSKSARVYCRGFGRMRFLRGPFPTLLASGARGALCNRSTRSNRGSRVQETAELERLAKKAVVLGMEDAIERELSRQADQRREGSYFHRRPLRTSLGPRTVGLTPGRPHHTSVRSRAVIAMSKTPSVLIADDEPNILLSLQFLMKKTGYEVRTAKDGEEALAEIVRAAPDLVLLDVMMPKIDGFSVCERIRANPEWNDVRIIMLTARGRDIEREKGLALGADDYITKPFSTKDAIARVEAVLARSRKA